MVSPSFAPTWNVNELAAPNTFLPLNLVSLMMVLISLAISTTSAPMASLSF